MFKIIPGLKETNKGIDIKLSQAGFQSAQREMLLFLDVGLED